MGRKCLKVFKASTVARDKLSLLGVPNDLDTISLMPARSKTERIAPPATIPLPATAGLISNLAPYFRLDKNF